MKDLIKRIRKELNINQEQLASLMGVSPVTVNLSRKETDKGPIALWNVKSEEVTLTSSRGEHGVTATLGSFNTFVAWTPANNAQFLCLEPMYSFGDASRPLELSQMYGITKLAKGESVTYSNEFRFF